MIAMIWGLPPYYPTYRPDAPDDSALGAPTRDDAGNPLPAPKATHRKTGTAIADDASYIARRMRELEGEQ